MEAFQVQFCDKNNVTRVVIDIKKILCGPDRYSINDIMQRGVTLEANKSKKRMCVRLDGVRAPNVGIDVTNQIVNLAQQLGQPCNSNRDNILIYNLAKDLVNEFIKAFL